jgi:cytochrome c biogenesis protein
MTTLTETAPRPPAQTWRADVMELLASMRFAIAMLTIICIAASIGTVLKQGEPLVNYVDAFGPFWSEVFGALGLFRIYSSPWFLIILAFLVLSTSLCIARNVPKIITDVRTYKEHIRVRALDAFHHKASGELSGGLQPARDAVVGELTRQGWQLKTETRSAEGAEAGGVMIAARRGMANKLGYIAAHSSIVLVCLGGLFDGDMIAKVQAWSQGLEPFKTGQPTAKNMLSMDNPAYRASLYVPEGDATGLAVLNVDKGMLVQPLPFDVELKKFIVDYYETGMPKRFASEIVVHDLKDKSQHKATVEVNKPFTYKGVTIFQQSFQDGGSLVRLKPIALSGMVPEGLGAVEGRVNGGGIMLPPPLTNGQPLSLEITELRVINVEDMARSGGEEGAGTEAGAEAVDARGVNFTTLSNHLGSGAKPGKKKLMNVGPSVTYKLRDAAGQAREFTNYLAPVKVDGQMVFMLGVRGSTMEAMRFLKVPADENLSMNGWLGLRTALLDPAMRAEAARLFAASATAPGGAEMQAQLQMSAQRVLDIYAGVPYDKDMNNPGGMNGLSLFLEKVVPEDDRERAGATLMQMLNGAMFQLYNLSRQQAGQAPLSLESEEARNYLTSAVLTIADALAYPAPVIFALESFEQKQASVFQVTRTPGRDVVYLGCALLIIGVFSMLYVRERRLWVWLQEQGQGSGTTLKMALSSTRQTMDVDAEFERLKQALLPGAAEKVKVS